MRPPLLMTRQLYVIFAVYTITMWFRYAEIDQKTGGKRPFLTGTYGMVFGMAAVGVALAKSPPKRAVSHVIVLLAVGFGSRLRRRLSSRPSSSAQQSASSSAQQSLSAPAIIVASSQRCE